MTDWRTVQQWLAALGFDPGPIDGIRGPRTDAAIVAFKRSIGFRARPYFGPLTEAALFAAPSHTQVPWFEIANQMRGLHEARDTARLRSWFDRQVAWIDPRTIPWCGAFVLTCLRQAGAAGTAPDNPLGARNWAGWGKPVTPCLGAVMVFWRGSPTGWQGHVGLYFGADADAYHILGGNQTNAVTVTRIDRRRFLAARWPVGLPVTTGPVTLTRDGQPLSTNEA